MLVATGYAAVLAASMAGFPADFNTTELDCSMRRLVYEQAKQLQPWHLGHRDTFDSLELDSLCGDAPPAREQPLPPSFPISETSGSVVYVSPLSGCDTEGLGTEDQPFRSVQHALEVTREVSRAQKLSSEKDAKTIVLRKGVHYLNETLVLGVADSGTTIQNYPGEEAWLSGAKLIPATQTWTPSAETPGVWETDVSALNITDVTGLFSVDAHRRFTRARYPNADTEIAQWGYASVHRFEAEEALPAGAVTEWWKPAKGAVPDYTYTDLTDPNNPSGHTKTDSPQPGYNAYGTGSGGVCATVWAGDSYWCGNVSSGGWAEVDSQCAAAGQLQLPVGMTYNQTYELNMTQPLPFGRWRNASGAVVHVWHSQSWAMHMFEVGNNCARASLNACVRGCMRAYSAITPSLAPLPPCPLAPLPPCPAARSPSTTRPRVSSSFRAAGSRAGATGAAATSAGTEPCGAGSTPTRRTTRTTASSAATGWSRTCSTSSTRRPRYGCCQNALRSTHSTHQPGNARR
jgi:hypothetical protein